MSEALEAITSLRARATTLENRLVASDDTLSSLPAGYFSSDQLIEYKKANEIIVPTMENVLKDLGINRFSVKARFRDPDKGNKEAFYRVAIDQYDAENKNNSLHFIYQPRTRGLFGHEEYLYAPGVRMLTRKIDRWPMWVDAEFAWQTYLEIGNQVDKIGTHCIQAKPILRNNVAALLKVVLCDPRISIPSLTKTTP
jgi:hypothetical protein